MNQKLKSILNILFINGCFLSLFLIILELIFGGWFISNNRLDNLGIRRNTNTQFKHHFYGPDSIVTNYSRDEFGFRGQSIFSHPEEIDILTIGGSTTDQLYITDSLTWQELLEGKLRKAGINLSIANAGKDGQSTHGHIKNFELWFPEIDNLKPMYVLFYIGINDYFAPKESSYDMIGTDHLSFPQKAKKYIKDHSVLYSLYRKVKGMIIAQKVYLGHDKIDFSLHRFDTFPRNGEHLTKRYLEKNIVPFKKRLNILIEMTEKMGAEPIFITQPSAKYRLLNGKVYGVEGTAVNENLNGVDYYFFLTLLNESIREVCKDKYQVIELTSLPIWEEDDFYDWFHMTPHGTKKLSTELFNQLQERLQ